jgi:succinoglycan biosynthesis protein ExoO
MDTHARRHDDGCRNLVRIFVPYLSHWDHIEFHEPSAMAALTTPIVSVVMPSFCAADTLHAAISSALDQTSPSLEIIVCDDASTDASKNIISSIRSPKVHFLQNTQNIGPGPSRDKAIAAATGKWIAFLDADDVWLPHRLERLLEAAGKSEDLILFDDIMICHDVRGRLVPWRAVHGPEAFNAAGKAYSDITLETYIQAPRLLMQPLIPRSFIQNNHLFHSGRRFGEDAEFFIKAGLAGARFRYVPEPMYQYRMQPGSLTAQSRDRSLMRGCLEDCLQLDKMTPSVRDALLRKMESLETNEAFYSLADSLREGHFIRAAGIMKSHPALWRILPRRVSSHLAYQLHRIRHRGRKWQ